MRSIFLLLIIAISGLMAPTLLTHVPVNAEEKGENAADDLRHATRALIADLKSVDPSIRYRACKAIEDEIAELQSELIEIAATKSTSTIDFPPEHCAARILGVLPAQSACNLLADRAGDEYLGSGVRPNASPLFGYPFAAALHRHGLAALPSVLRVIERAPRDKISDETISLYARIMRTANALPGGSDQTVAIMRRAREQMDDTANIDRLIEATAAMEDRSR